MKHEKLFKTILIATETIWLMLLLAACVAFFKVITAHAEDQPIAIIYQDEEQRRMNAKVINEAPPINRISEDLDEQDANGHQMECLGEYYVTRYCSCRKCSGKWGTTSASGRPLVVNYSCASPLPFGTVVEIEGYGRCEVVDRTSDKTVRNTGGKIIDIYTSNHAEAEEWGCKKLKVWRVK